MLAYQAFYNVLTGLWDYAKIHDLIYGVGYEQVVEARFDISRTRKVGKIPTFLSVNYDGPWHAWRNNEEYYHEHDEAHAKEAFYHRQVDGHPDRDVVLMYVSKDGVAKRIYVLIERRIPDAIILDAWYTPKPDDLRPVWRKGEMNGLVSGVVNGGIAPKWYA